MRLESQVNVEHGGTFSGVRVVTRIMPEGIVQDDYSVLGEVVSHIGRSVAHVKDEHLRAALITLGWTPPPGPCGCGVCEDCRDGAHPRAGKRGDESCL